MIAVFLPLFQSLRLRDRLLLGGVTLALLALRVVYLLLWCPYGLAPDEAQYWHWLVYPDFSYVTKPPLTTWLMGISTRIWGDTLLGVRFFSVLAQALLPLIGAALAVAAATPARAREAALWVFFLMTTLPLVAAGGLMMSPDVVLTPLWFLAVLMALPLVHAENDRSLWGRWLGVGFLVGLGGLAKYTAVLFFPLVGLYALVHKPRLLKRPGVYGAGILALLMQAPVLYWNATHGWEGVKHVLWQGGDNNDTRWGGLPSLFNFLGGQVGVVGLVLFPLMVLVWLWGARREKDMTPGGRFIWWMSFPVFAAFLLQSLDAKVQPNWPILGVVGGVVLVGVFVAGVTYRWAKAVVVGGMVVSAVASAALYDTQVLRDAGVPLRVKIDPTKDMMGMREMGNLTAILLSQLQPGSVLLASRYQTVAALAFHVPAVAAKPALLAGHYGGKVAVLYQNPGNKRMTEYDLWPWPSMQGRMALYVSEQEGVPPAVAQRFDRCESWQKAQIAVRGVVVRTMFYALCWNGRTLVSDKVLHP